MTKRKKQTGRYVVEINDWGCGVLIKDTITGKEIDAPAEETVNLCLVEMNRLAAEVADLKSEADRLKAEVENSKRINTELLALSNRQASDIRRLTKAGDELSIALAAFHLIHRGKIDTTTQPDIIAWNAAKDGKPSE